MTYGIAAYTDMGEEVVQSAVPYNLIHTLHIIGITPGTFTVPISTPLQGGTIHTVVEAMSTQLASLVPDSAYGSTVDQTHNLNGSTACNLTALSLTGQNLSVTFVAANFAAKDLYISFYVARR